MTKEQKVEWMKKVNAERLIEQLRWEVLMAYEGGSDAMRMESKENYELIKAELLNRMKGGEPHADGEV